MKNTYEILCRKPQGKRPLERLTCRWDNIKFGLREIVCDVMGLIELAQDRIGDCVNTLMNMCSIEVGNFLTS
jgi:hypothetical protein